MDQLDGYDGVLTPSYNKMRLGLIYKSVDIEVNEVSEILKEQGRAFPRFPLLIDTTRLEDGVNINFIVVHLKAFGDPSSQNRRYQANQAIISYIEGELAADPEKNLSFLVISMRNIQEMLWEDESVPASIVTESIEKADGGYPGRKL